MSNEKAFNSLNKRRTRLDTNQKKQIKKDNKLMRKYAKLSKACIGSTTLSNLSIRTLSDGCELTNVKSTAFVCSSDFILSYYRPQFNTNEKDMDRWAQCNGDTMRYFISLLPTKKELKLMSNNGITFPKKEIVIPQSFCEIYILLENGNTYMTNAIKLSLYHYIDDKIIHMCRNYIKDADNEFDFLDEYIPKDKYYLLFGYSSGDFQLTCTGSVKMLGTMMFEHPKATCAREIKEESNQLALDIKPIMINGKNIFKDQKRYGKSLVYAFSYITYI